MKEVRAANKVVFVNGVLDHERILFCFVYLFMYRPEEAVWRVSETIELLIFLIVLRSSTLKQTADKMDACGINHTDSSADKYAG